tara:strand:+ start:186 stop:1346 length:1161 start_codon:yes stop_codon:yes gene_type:complete
LKVLYLGYYRDGTGWAKAAQNYIMALHCAGVDVVPRYVKLNDVDGEIYSDINILESKSDKNCDVVIQHLLPHHMDFNGNFDKNIALYVTETDNCLSTGWPERLNLMDEAWVPNKYMAEEVCKNSGIFIPHYVVPHAFDMSIYQEDNEKLEIPELEGRFVFYYIGDITRRKNIGALLKAFHSEFSPDENVSIALKCSHPGFNPQQTEAAIKEICYKVKDGLKLYPSESYYHKEVLICDYVSEKEIMQIHSSFDCLLSSSFGEAWGIPIFDAMAMGKTPICTDTAGPSLFLENGGYLVKSSKQHCFGVSDTFAELYTGREKWDVIDIAEMRVAMRSAFENAEDREERSSAGISNAYKYSHANIGNTMKMILEGSDKIVCYNQNTEQHK